ncbi:MAG: hypothetical protein QXN37_01275 [Candidatus Anstonellaceae archaeon]
MGSACCAETEPKVAKAVKTAVAASGALKEGVMTVGHWVAHALEMTSAVLVRVLVGCAA